MEKISETVITRELIVELHKFLNEVAGPAVTALLTVPTSDSLKLASAEFIISLAVCVDALENYIKNEKGG